MNNFCIVIQEPVTFSEPSTLKLGELNEFRLYVDMDSLVRNVMDEYDKFIFETNCNVDSVAISLDLLAKYSNTSKVYLDKKITRPLKIQHGSIPITLLVLPKLKQEILVVPQL